MKICKRVRGKGEENGCVQRKSYGLKAENRSGDFEMKNYIYIAMNPKMTLFAFWQSDLERKIGATLSIELKSADGDYIFIMSSSPSRVMVRSKFFVTRMLLLRVKEEEKKKA